MSEENSAPRPERPMTPATRRWVILWVATIGVLYATGAFFAVRALRRYRAEDEAVRHAFVAASADDGRAEQVDAKALDALPAVEVGLFVHRFNDTSAPQDPWTADFDVWFRWTDPDLAPGDAFTVANGDVVQREKVEERESGGERYVRYAMKARLQSVFDPGRFPFGDEGLAIEIEDRSQRGPGARYVADLRQSGLNRFGAPPNQDIEVLAPRVLHYSEAIHRDRRAEVAPAPRVRSRFTFALLRAPPGWKVHIRNFQALFASVAIALVAFFIKPTYADGRFGLGIGAIFAAIASNVAVAGALPEADRFTLTAMINAVGLATIFLSLLASTISLYILDGMESQELRHLFDRASFVVCAIGYVAVNLLLPLAALPVTPKPS